MTLEIIGWYCGERKPKYVQFETPGPTRSQWGLPFDPETCDVTHTFIQQAYVLADDWYGRDYLPGELHHDESFKTEYLRKARLFFAKANRQGKTIHSWWQEIESLKHSSDFGS